MKSFLFACLLLLFVASGAFAQRRVDKLDCEVALIAVAAKHWGIHSIPIKEVGRFEAFANIQTITRSFALLDTGLFAIAHVSPSPNSGGSKNPESIAFWLMISRREQLNMNPLDVKQVQYMASADVGLNSLDSVTVSTLMKHKEEPLIAVLQCRKRTQD
jgi:hypothetical protein